VNDLRPALGARIKELRKRLGISQEELAGRAGMHWTYLSDLERGRQTPTLDMLNRVARGLDVTLAEFFSTLDEPYRARFRKRRRDVHRRTNQR
jgi:transcriptional regulator with XRE-family HTH domain